MNIQTKTLAIIFSSFLVLMLVLSLTLKNIITEKYLQLEQTDLHNHLQRALNIISLEESNLEQFIGDWATWDDSYYFIKNKNKAYIKSNLTDGSFTINNLAFIAYLKKSGEIVYGRSYDLKREQQVSLPNSLLPYLQPGKKLFPTQNNKDAITGLINLPEGVFLISSHPINTGSNNQLSPGFLVFGRRFDDEFISKLSDIIKLVIKTHPNNDTLTPDLKFATQHLNPKDKYFSLASDEKIVSGYTFIYDINNNPILLLQLDIKRAIYQQGITTTNYITLAIIIIIIVIVLVVFILMHNLILKRISKLSSEVNDIQDSKNISKRITESGNDEISMLSHNINNMLSTIDNIHHDLDNSIKLAESASSVKSQFLSRMSHELRTPMNAILGFSQLLDHGAEPLTERQSAHVKVILEAGDHLLNLIDDVLDLSKIESGKMEIFLEEVPVEDVVKQCISLTGSMVEARQLELIDHVSSMGHRVQADFTRFKQVLLNLLSNAVKYNRKNGSITLTCKVINEQRLRISIADNGEGLTKDDIAKLYTPFERLNVINNVEGTGIGLAISKHLIELMGGTIGVDSKVGEGSVFWFELEMVNDALEV